MLSNLLWCFITLGLVVSTMPIVEKYYLMLVFSLALPCFIIYTYGCSRLKKYEVWAFAFVSVAFLNFPILMLNESLLAATSMLICFVIMFCCERALHSRRDFIVFNRLMIVLMVYIFFECVFQLIFGSSLLLGYGLMFGHKSTGPFPNTYADTLSIVFVFYFALLGFGPFSVKNSKVLTLIILLMCFFVLVISGSRAAILMLFTSILFGYFFVYDVSKAVVRFLTSISTTLFLFFVFYFLFSDVEFFHRFFYKINNLVEVLQGGLVIDDINSTTIRLLIWRDLIDLWCEQPLYLLFGYGFGTLPFANADVFHREYLNVADAQNVWLDLIYSVGFFGTGCFILFVFKFYHYLVRNVDDKFVRISVLCLVFWPINPFSVQHKLEAAWYFMQISFSWIIASYVIKIYKGQVR
ncbi:membrane hypothetical protein [Vibrio crassostreae]|uniref:O-antigen ligase family protein n=1 Tax=Vibrio crassostreae TaxID=246167 RepID=UPI001B30EA9B|nr:O-antigen ligase family protein [Vibrio crassostreae]CAK1935260.1 membrane hypothetical protein [Vibrio crassostreae]CAK1940589.1 membrane hypothetical protein [Vibrio crassostreae]CAK1941267.1 membrane hypothetical protein [Vibrio crassostreae]CAK1944728.1 membrane hypothetical protein [Vibrio crassostreae]CAK1945763.1 membrane hypothetical protein [Vibrio crassostreae]